MTITIEIRAERYGPSVAIDGRDVTTTGAEDLAERFVDALRAQVAADAEDSERNEAEEACQRKREADHRAREREDERRYDLWHDRGID